jgi:hypothetical protein
VICMKLTNRGPMIEILISKDQVIIENQVVKRPANIGRSQWLSFWEKMLYKPASDNEYRWIG